MSRADFILEKGEQLFKETCEIRYPDRATMGASYSNMTEQEYEKLQRTDVSESLLLL